MMMSGGVTSCCVALLLTLTAVSSVQRLNSIDELIQKDPSLYEQICALLEWFATTAEIHDNGIRLTFDPQAGDYGSHYYSNFEGLLEQTWHGQRYYTLGNIKQESHLKLPWNVVKNRRNSVRIIVRIRDVIQGMQAQRIERVYITQHNGTRVDGKCYDPVHTYEISTRLLRQMRDDLRSRPSYRNHNQEVQWSAVDVLMKIFFFILLVFIIGIISAISQQPKSRWP